MTKTPYCSVTSTRWFQVTGVSGFATETRAKDAMLSLACLAAALPASLCNGLIGRTPAKAHRPRAGMGILWGALAFLCRL